MATAAKTVDYTAPEVQQEIGYTAHVAEPLSKNDMIAIGIVGSVVASFIGAVSYFSFKQEQKNKAEYEARQTEMKRKREERQAWFDKVRRDGKTVIETRDGTFIAIPNEAYAAADVRKKAL